jgi:hypothetical protein
MPTSLLLLADTHLPKRAKQLPAAVWQAVAAADVVFHAGDWVNLALLDELTERANRLIGVVGNNDGEALRARLPEVTHEIIDGVRFALVHETGASTGREKRMDATFSDIDVLIFGHSHIPWDTVTPAGTRLLNPGSPTDRRRQPFATMITAVADAGTLRDVTLIRLSTP